jgi:hypothetical protein
MYIYKASASPGSVQQIMPYYVCMYKWMYIQYKQGLCQSRLSTGDHALLLTVPATTAVCSLERSYAWPPPSLSLLYEAKLKLVVLVI